MINLIFKNLSVSFIFSITFITIMTSLGSSLIFFIKKNNLKLTNILLGISAGIMLSSAIFSLIIPALNYSNILFISVGILLGVLFLIITNKIINKKNNTIIITIISIVLHNIPEGAIIGIAYGSILSNNSNLSSALALAIGIGIQNIPEGTAIAIPLLKNNTKLKAFLLGTLSGIVEPIFAIIGFFLVTKITKLLPFSLAFAAGAMLYITIYELIPSSQNSENKNLITFFTILGFILMLVMEKII